MDRFTCKMDYCPSTGTTVCDDCIDLRKEDPERIKWEQYFRDTMEQLTTLKHFLQDRMLITCQSCGDISPGLRGLCGKCRRKLEKKD